MVGLLWSGYESTGKDVHASDPRVRLDKMRVGVDLGK